LELLVTNELSRSIAAELEQHVRSCPRCRHELDWLKTEQGLFRQRAGRDEVAYLWKGVAARSGLAATRVWPRVLAGLAVTAAVVLMAVGLQSRGSGELHDLATAPAQSESIMSMGGMSLAPGNGGPECSTLPQGLGFHCGPVEDMRFLASR